MQRTATEVEAIVVRRFSEADALKVSRLISRCLNETLIADFTKDQLEFFHRRFTPGGLQRIAAECDMLVAVRGRQILGTASLENGRVKAVFVNPTLYRKGIGQLLMKHIEIEARRRGFDTCVLYSNRRATWFYAKVGYKRLKEVEDHGLKLVLMRKRLD
jgi:GNAT superfamily N-acetyltransferase